MQKTLLYTEGLGREFFPELDLWKTSQPILEKWMKKQKGFFSLMKKFRENSSYLIDIFPEIPTSIHRIIRLINNKGFDLDKNLKQLKRIEEEIKKNKTRNYWYFSVLIFLVPPTIMAIILSNFDKLDLFFSFLEFYVPIILLFIFLLKPKR